jgi:hypothetical protein
MRSFIILTVLALVTGCRQDVYYNIVPGDSPCDTAETDYDVVDTADTDTDVVDTDTAATDCEYVVEVVDNGDGSTEAILHNVVWLTLSTSSPSGAAVPGRAELFRFNVAAAWSECSDITLKDFALDIHATDNANSDWASNMAETGIDLYNLTLDGTSQVARHNEAHVNHATSFVLWISGDDIVIPAGETYTFAVYGDTTGASSSEDDSIRVDLSPSRMIVSDGETEVRLANDVVNGNTLVY